MVHCGAQNLQLNECFQHLVKSRIIKTSRNERISHIEIQKFFKTKMFEAYVKHQNFKFKKVKKKQLLKKAVPVILYLNLSMQLRK